MKRSLGPRTLVCPAPVLVVGTYNKDGKPNVMTASWGGMACSEPACVAVSLRQASSTYSNILQRKAFTLSIASEPYVKQVDYFGLVSGRTTDKFKATKLTAVKSKLVDAPYVKEFPLVLECKLVHATELGLHTQFIGEVIDVKAGDEIIGRDGAVDMRKLRPLIFTPDTQDYFGVGTRVAKVFSAGKDI